VRQGLLAEVPEKLGEREQTRQADLARLVRLAEGREGGGDDFVELLHDRFGARAGRGVHLPTPHRGESLQREAVFPPRVEGGGAACGLSTGRKAWRGRRSSCRVSRKGSSPSGAATSRRSGGCFTSA